MMRTIQACQISFHRVISASIANIVCQSNYCLLFCSWDGHEKLKVKRGSVSLWKADNGAGRVWPYDLGCQTQVSDLLARLVKTFQARNIYRPCAYIPVGLKTLALIIGALDDSIFKNILTLSRKSDPVLALFHVLVFLLQTRIRGSCAKSWIATQSWNEMCVLQLLPFLVGPLYFRSYDMFRKGTFSC